jgi:hypothetical protein
MCSHGFAYQNSVFWSIDIDFIDNFTYLCDFARKKIIKHNFEGCRQFISIEANKHKPLLAQLTSPKLPVKICSSFFEHHFSLFSKRILVHCDDFLVSQYL